MNQTQMPIDDQAAGTFWNDLGVFATGGSTTLTVQLRANPSAAVLADAVRLVEYAGPATTNLHINSLPPTVAGNLWVSYTITGAAAPQFNIGVYGSTNGVSRNNSCSRWPRIAPILARGRTPSRWA